MRQAPFRSPLAFMLNPGLAFPPTKQPSGAVAPQPPQGGAEPGGVAGQVLAAAHAWWESKRPAQWTLQQHLQAPDVGCETPAEKALAQAVASWERTTGTPACAQSPSQQALSPAQQRAVDLLREKPLSREGWRDKKVSPATMQSLIAAGLVEIRKRPGTGHQVWALVAQEEDTESRNG